MPFRQRLVRWVPSYHCDEPRRANQIFTPAFLIVVALITVVVGSLFLQDRHNESIWAEVQPGGNPVGMSSARA
jgi:hypothetical protein